MTRLPVVKPDEVIVVLKRIGYIIDHQTGSHVILYCEDRPPVTVPKHHRDMKKGTLQHILRAAGLSVDDFIRLR